MEYKWAANIILCMESIVQKGKYEAEVGRNISIWQQTFIYFFKKKVKLKSAKNVMVFFLFVCFLSFFDSCLYEKNWEVSEVSVFSGDKSIFQTLSCFTILENKVTASCSSRHF